MTALARRLQRAREELWGKRPRCGWCGHAVVILYKPTPHPPDTATIDHLVPLSEGGTHDIDNLMLACISCNRLRGNAPAETFAAWLRTKAGRIWKSQRPVTRATRAHALITDWHNARHAQPRDER